MVKMVIALLIFIDIVENECIISGIKSNMKIEKYWTTRIAEGFTQVKGIKSKATAKAL